MSQLGPNMSPSGCGPFLRPGTICPIIPGLTMLFWRNRDSQWIINEPGGKREVIEKKGFPGKTGKVGNYDTMEWAAVLVLRL